MSGPVTEDRLAAYFEACNAERMAEIADALRGMNPRERALVQEAAVMGYVRGMMAANAGAKRPDDSPKLIEEVVDACLSMPDLYPTMERVRKAGMKRREAVS